MRTRNGERGGALLELELPGLLVLRLLQVLPHADVLIVLVLNLCLHRLQLGVELRGDGRGSEAARCGGGTVTRPGPHARRLGVSRLRPGCGPRLNLPRAPSQIRAGYSKGRPVPPDTGACYLLPLSGWQHVECSH